MERINKLGSRASRITRCSRCNKNYNTGAQTAWEYNPSFDNPDHMECICT